MKRRVEQVGSAYEKKKLKVHKQLLKFADNQKKRAANSAHVDAEHSGSEEEEEETKGPAQDKNEEWEKKRHRRTKEQIEQDMLLIGDLYAILGLEHLTFEAGDGDIKSAYKKMALMYHPDKLGENITESDKEIFLKI